MLLQLTIDGTTGDQIRARGIVFLARQFVVPIQNSDLKFLYP